MLTTGLKSACAAGKMTRGERRTQRARVRHRGSRPRVHIRVGVAGPSCSEEPTLPPGVRRFSRVTLEHRAGGTSGARSSPPFLIPHLDALSLLFRSKRPSEWLRLDRAQVGMLVQSIRSIKLKGAHPDTDKSRLWARTDGRGPL